MLRQPHGRGLAEPGWVSFSPLLLIINAGEK